MHTLGPITLILFKFGVNGRPLESAVSLVVCGRNKEKEFVEEAAVYEHNRHKRDLVMLNSVEQILPQVTMLYKYSKFIIYWIYVNFKLC